MKKILKIMLPILFLIILVLEIYVYFFKSKQNISNEISKKTNVQEEKIDTEHLANLYTGYNKDNLIYDVITENEQVYYTTISGLKNKNIEKNINQKIKEKIDKLKDKIDSNHSLSNDIVSNFENTLSIGFCINEKNENGKFNECSLTNDYIDSLNFDLTTGNELKITDIVNTKQSLKDQLLKQSYEDFSKYVGIVCGGGPCTLDNPDYSMVEEEQLQVASKFNKEKYYFVFDPKEIKLIFNDLNIKRIYTCWENENGSYDASVAGTPMKVKDNYQKEYTSKLELINLIDNLLIYDKFKTNDNIYEKDSTKINMKFSLELSENDGYDSDMIQSDSYLVDYSLLDTFGMNFITTAKASLLKEMITNDNKFNIYNVFGKIHTIGNYNYLTKIGSSYNYVNYDVYQYSLDKNIFEENKKKIYVDKYNKISLEDGPYYNYDSNNKDYVTYTYLKDYLSKNKFFYYIYDINGKRVDTSNILNKEYLNKVIPDEWYSLGKYKTIDEMVKNALIIDNEKHNYPNNLVINDGYYNNNGIKLKYKGKEIVLANTYNECQKVVNDLYK